MATIFYSTKLRRFTFTDPATRESIYLYEMNGQPTPSVCWKGVWHSNVDLEMVKAKAEGLFDIVDNDLWE